MKAKPWTLLTLSFLATTLVATSYQDPLAAQSLSPPPPVMAIPVSQSGITVRLVNRTVNSITYEALGDTQPRDLTAGEEVTLQNLNMPATLTFFYQDIQKDRQVGEGLLQAELRFDEATEILDIVVRPTTSLGTDVSNITIEPNGDTFVF